MKSKVKSEENLWNAKEGKTRKVIEYINNLEPLVRWDSRDELSKIKEFHRRIGVALSKTTANDMLKSIGYRFERRPGMFNTIEGMGKRKKR